MMSAVSLQSFKDPATAGGSPNADILICFSYSFLIKMKEMRPWEGYPWSRRKCASVSAWSATSRCHARKHTFLFFDHGLNLRSHLYCVLWREKEVIVCALSWGSYHSALINNYFSFSSSTDTIILHFPFSNFLLFLMKEKVDGSSRPDRRSPSTVSSLSLLKENRKGTGKWRSPLRSLK